MAIKDLTNTTWVVPAGWSATAGLVQANITGSVFCEDAAATPIDLNTELGNAYTFSIGYRSITATLSDRIYINTSAYGDPRPNILASSYAFTITITGGADVANPTLISWLETYGELQGGDAPTDAVTIEYNGSVIASLKAGQSAKLPCKDILMHTDLVVSVPDGMGGSVEEWDGSYTVSGGLPSFTIDGTTYYFEDGMTWGEWCDSEYNIDNTYYYDNYYVNSTLKVGYITTATNNYQPIPPTDAIIDGQAYIILSTGGAID